MRGRLIIAIITTALEETAMAVGVLWGLPKLGIYIPLWVLIIVMLGWFTYTVTTYRMGSRALRREPITGLLNMHGSEGKVVSPLMPEGTVRIRGELWLARAERGVINAGEEITVVGQDRLTLVVRRRNPGGLAGTN